MMYSRFQHNPQAPKFTLSSKFYLFVCIRLYKHPTLLSSNLSQALLWKRMKQIISTARGASQFIELDFSSSGCFTGTFFWEHLAPFGRVDKFSTLRGVSVLRAGLLFLSCSFSVFSFHVPPFFHSPFLVSLFDVFYNSFHILSAVIIPFFLQLLVFILFLHCSRYDNRIIFSILYQPIRNRIQKCFATFSFRAFNQIWKHKMKVLVFSFPAIYRTYTLMNFSEFYLKFLLIRLAWFFVHRHIFM